MKTELTFIIQVFSLLVCPYLNSQNVIIPDANFKSALISNGINSSMDGEISYSEAEVVTTLALNGSNIDSLDGIEAFINLAYLECSDNNLTHVDFASNPLLIYLVCNDNVLSSLNLLSNSYLEVLHCNNNLLSVIDLTSNNALRSLSCSGNQLTELDLSNNTAITDLNCDNNYLTTIDLTNNSALNYLSLINMPSLILVCVWVMPFPPPNVYVYTDWSPNVMFTDSCSDTTNILGDNISYQIQVYPNPAKDKIFVKIPNSDRCIVKINDLAGNQVYHNDSYYADSEIPINFLVKGIYLIKLQTGHNIFINKLLIQ